GAPQPGLGNCRFFRPDGPLGQQRCRERVSLCGTETGDSRTLHRRLRSHRTCPTSPQRPRPDTPRRTRSAGCLRRVYPAGGDAV
ncbi:MAG: hypothetical protein AVDCRST_MAG86-2280, partial [uncultured Truepera sp.]